MPFKESRRRNSINPRDIIGQVAGGNVIAGGISTATSAGGRSLVAEYESAGVQNILLPSKARTNTALNIATAVQASTLVTSASPFTLTSNTVQTLWVEAECTFTPSAHSERYALACHSGTPTSKGDAAFTFRHITRGAAMQMFVQGIVDMENLDELNIVLSCYNTHTASETLLVTDAAVWVYSV